MQKFHNCLKISRNAKKCWNYPPLYRSLHAVQSAITFTAAAEFLVEIALIWSLLNYSCWSVMRCVLLGASLPVIVLVGNRPMTLDAMKAAKEYKMFNGRFLFVCFWLAYCK